MMRLDSYIFGCSRSKLIGTIAVLCAMVACSKEYPTIPGSDNRIGFEVSSSDCDWNKLKSGICIVEGYGGPDSLFLHTSISDRPSIIDSMTKGSIITEDDFYSSIGVHAFSFKGDWTEELTPNWMYNEEVTQESGWSTDFFWPSEIYNVRFFAYAPYNCDNLRLSQNSATGTPTFDYTIPNDVAEHKDIIVAASRTYQGNHSGTAELEFTHALTAVRFVAGNDMLPGKVTKVTLKGVFANGTYSYADNSWTPSGAYVSYSQEVDVNVDGIPGQPITAAEQTFMMLPQTLPSGAKIEINFIDDLTSQTHTLSASLAGTEWEPGKLVSYRISTSSISVVPVLTVEIPDFTYEGGTMDFSVLSFATVTSAGSSETIAMPWEACFVEEDGNGGYVTVDQPEWISEIVLSGEGDTQSQIFNISVKPQEHITERAHNDILKATQAVSGIYDLATDGGTSQANTANCYIINAPGVYSFPLVYGNAIKNGTDNTSSYIHPYPDDITVSFLTIGLNHLGNEITSPYIYKNADCEPHKAELLWQDEKDLLSNIRLSENKQDILFDVSRENISQGNAVIVLRDKDGTIMWNWHIWVTDYKLGEDEDVFLNEDKTVRMLPYEIGYSDTYYHIAAERTAYIKFTGTGIEHICKITQQQDKKTIFGNAVFYAWGRKDPVCGWSGTVDAKTETELYKTRYNRDGESLTGPFETDSTWPSHEEHLVLSIQHPDILSAGNSQYTLFNLWNNGSVGTTLTRGEYYPHVKTIYDPSPKGYRVAQVKEFDALKNYPYSQSDENRISEIQTEGGSIIFRMVNSGYHEEIENCSYCSYWTSLGTSNNAYLCNMQRSIGTNNASRTYMCPIRPIAEQ